LFFTKLLYGADFSLNSILIFSILSSKSSVQQFVAFIS
jgi:hypothetical protein